MENTFYSDIKMGCWAFPWDIGCLNFSWSVFIRKYDYSRPHVHNGVKYGYECFEEKLWLSELSSEVAVFDNSDNINSLRLAVGKLDCMDLFKRVQAAKFQIVGKPSGKFWNVYKRHGLQTQSYLLSFSSFFDALQYRQMMIEIPYDKYMTEENMHIREYKV